MSYAISKDPGDAKTAIIGERSTPLYITIVTETWRPDINGVAMTCGKMADGLVKLGAHVQVVQTTTQSPTLEPHLELITLGSFNLPFYKEVSLGLPSYSSLKKIWQGNRPDLVLLVTEGPLGLSALHTAKKLKIPVVSEFHTNFQLYSKHYGVGFLEPFIRRYLKYFHNQTLKTFVPTEELQQQLESEGFNALCTVARGVDTELFTSKRRSQALREQWGLNPNQLVVIYVGRIAAEKNINLAIKAFRQIKMLNSGAQFIMVGDGPMRSKLQTENSDFIFCGMQTGTELAEHYASADLCLIPGTTETFGNVLLEAMASGLAVVCFDYAAAKEHLQNQHNGCSVILHDELAYIRATLVLASNTALRQSMGQWAERSMHRYSWDNVYHDFLHNITSLLNNSAVAPGTNQTPSPVEITESHQT